MVAQRLCEYVLCVDDIAEKAGTRIHALLKMLCRVESRIPLRRDLVKSWPLVHQLIDFLHPDQNLVTLHNKFDGGELEALSGAQLEQLLKAVFAESSKRNDIIVHIRACRA